MPSEDTIKKVARAFRLARTGEYTVKQIADKVRMSKSWVYDHHIHTAIPAPYPASGVLTSSTSTPGETSEAMADFLLRFEGPPDPDPVTDPAAAQQGPANTPSTSSVDALASTQKSAERWPGVRDRSGSLLCDNAKDFQQLLGAAAQAFRVREENLVRDYHMCRTLRSLFVAHPPGSLFEDRYNNHKGRPVSALIGPLLFAGGSSLTNAYQLADRISEDIDLTVATRVDIEAKNARSRIRRLAVIAAAKACSPELPDEAHERRKSGGDIGRRIITVGDTPKYLIAEASILRPFDPDLQAELDQISGGTFDVHRIVGCQSLMGRVANADTASRYPELAPSAVAALCVPITATNKFFAMHRRAMKPPTEENLIDLAKRGRDVYDLWSIAQSRAHAVEVRDTVATIARHVQKMGATPEPHPRPAGGFSSSPVFDPATEQYEALKAGYNNVLRLVWGRRPMSFAAAVDDIKSLDP